MHRRNHFRLRCRRSVTGIRGTQKRAGSIAVTPTLVPAFVHPRLKRTGFAKLCSLCGGVYGKSRLVLMQVSWDQGAKWAIYWWLFCIPQVCLERSRCAEGASTTGAHVGVPTASRRGRFISKGRFTTFICVAAASTIYLTRREPR